MLYSNLHKLPVSVNGSILQNKVLLWPTEEADHAYGVESKCQKCTKNQPWIVPVIKRQSVDITSANVNVKYLFHQGGREGNCAAIYG